MKKQFLKKSFKQCLNLFLRKKWELFIGYLHYSTVENMLHSTVNAYSLVLKNYLFASRYLYKKSFFE